jgi:hypothetical protein
MRSISRGLLATFLLAGLLCVEGTAQTAEPERQSPDGARLELILARVGESVERYLGGMFSITFKEVLRSEGLKDDLTPKGKSKEYVFENIVVREQRSAADRDFYGKAIRRLKSVDGKSVKPSKQKGELDKCGAPGSSYADPLTFLLPKYRARLSFNYEGEEVLRGRKTYRLGFLPREEVRPEVRHEGGCFHVGATHKGTVWIDAENFDVLQTASRLVEGFEFESPRPFSAGFGRFGPKRKLRFERAEHLMRFRRVGFKDTGQELLLPEYSESLRIVDGAREPRVRFTRYFEDYRRFVSDVKIIETDEPEN